MDVIKQTEPATATPWPRPAVTRTVKMTQTGDSGPYTVHILNHEPGLNLVNMKHSGTEYWTENKPDSIPDAGYSSKPTYVRPLGWWLPVKYTSLSMAVSKTLSYKQRNWNLKEIFIMNVKTRFSSDLFQTCQTSPHK